MMALLKRPDILMGGVLVASLGLILTALGYQHLADLQPCDLCYKQRWAYYIAIGAVPFALFLYGHETKDTNEPLPAKSALMASALVMALLALVFFANFVLGVYHAGVEWKFWAGPAGCSDTGAFDTSISIIEAMKQETIVPCGVAQWRLFGISMAGYSALASLMLALVAGFIAHIVGFVERSSSKS